MKQIFLYFFVLVSLTLSAQRQLPSYNTAAGTLTQTGAGSGYVDVRINYSDQTGITTGSTVDNTCVLLYFNTDESLGYELPILSVTTPSATNPVVRVNITGFPSLNGAINGQGVIYKKSSSKHFAPFVSNASNSLQQVIQEAMARDIETALNSATDVTKYVGSGIPAFTPTTNEPKLAQGLSSPYPLYKWNGSAWVLDGSGGGSIADTTRTAYKYATMKWTDSTALHADNKVFKDTLINGHNILLNNYPTMDASGTITNGDLFSKYDAETGVYQKLRADSLKAFIGSGLSANSVDSTHIKPASLSASGAGQSLIDTIVRIARKDSISSNSGYLYFSQAAWNKRHFRVATFSDSRGDAGYLDASFRDTSCAMFGDGGIGLINMGTNYPLLATTYPTMSGTTQLSHTGLALNHPVGYARQFAQNDYWQVSTVSFRFGKFDTVTIYYPIQVAAITYRVDIDGVSAGTFTTTTGVSGVGSATISGFTNAKHVIRITQTSTGTGVLFDADLKSSDKGIRWAKFAHTGISPQLVADYANAGNFNYFSSANDVDLAVIRLGVNGASSTPAKTAGVYIDSIASKIKSFANRSDILILGEPDNNDGNGTIFYSKAVIDDYNFIYDSLAYAKGYGFISLKDVASNWTYFSKAIGTTDLLHENRLGGLYYAKHIVKNIFNSTPRQNYLTKKYNTPLTTVLDSIIKLNGVITNGSRGVDFQTNGTSYGRISYDASSSNLVFDNAIGRTYGWGGRIQFISDGRSRLFFDGSGNKQWTASANSYDFYKSDTTVAFSYTPSAFAVNANQFLMSGTNHGLAYTASGLTLYGENPYVKINGTSTLNPTQWHLGSDRFLYKHTHGIGIVIQATGKTFGWGGKMWQEVDGTIRTKLSATTGFVINFDTASAVNPVTIFGLKAGSTSDSIVTSNSGVLKRLSIAEVVKAGTNSQIATPLTGTTVTIASTTTRLLLQPASTLTTLTIAFPSSPIDGQTIRISVGSPAGITSGVTACPSVTYSNGTIFGTTPSTLTGGDTVDFQWDNASSVWRRIVL